MISRIFDYIEKKASPVSPQKEIEMHKAKMAIDAQLLAAQQQQYASNMPYQNQQGFVQYVAGSLGGAGYSPVGGAYITTGVTTTSVYGAMGGGGGGNGAVWLQPNAVYTTPMVGQPNGINVSIAFTDTNGRTMILDIDGAYVNIMQEISTNHLKMHGFNPNPPAALPDPDFDLDELAMASDLVEQLDGARPESP